MTSCVNMRINFTTPDVASSQSLTYLNFRRCERTHEHTHCHRLKRKGKRSRGKNGHKFSVTLLASLTFLSRVFSCETTTPKLIHHNTYTTTNSHPPKPHLSRDLTTSPAPPNLAHLTSSARCQTKHLRHTCTHH